MRVRSYADDDKDREPEHLVDRRRKECVEVNPEDRDDKDGVDRLLDDGPSALRASLSLFPRPEGMTEDAHGVGVDQVLLSPVPDHDEEMRRSGGDGGGGDKGDRGAEEAKPPAAPA